MKKINFFSTILMIAIFTIMQFAGKAQSFSIAPSAGVCIDQEGLLRQYDPVVGLTAMLGLGPTETSMFSLGLDMSGGQRYRYQTMIKSMDLKRDSSVWRTTNAPSVMAWAMLNIPQGGGEGDEGGANKFAGPVVGIGYGMAFPNMSSEPGNVFKIFLQGNYCVKEGKTRISIFARPALNVLYSKGIHESWDMSAGILFTMFGSSGDSDY